MSPHEAEDVSLAGHTLGAMQGMVIGVKIGLAIGVVIAAAVVWMVW